MLLVLTVLAYRRSESPILLYIRFSSHVYISQWLSSFREIIFLSMSTISSSKMRSQNLVAIRKQICQQASIDAPEDPCSSCDFIQGTEHKPYAGGQCNVYALNDHIGRCVATRVFRRPDRSSEFILSNELKYRREIKRCGIKFFEDIISFSEKGNQLIRNPFICLSWAEGEPLIWSDCIPETRSDRNNLIKKIANICFDLLSIQEECKEIVLCSEKDNSE